MRTTLKKNRLPTLILRIDKSTPCPMCFRDHCAELKDTDNLSVFCPQCGTVADYNMSGYNSRWFDVPLRTSPRLLFTQSHGWREHETHTWIVVPSSDRFHLADPQETFAADVAKTRCGLYTQGTAITTNDFTLVDQYAVAKKLGTPDGCKNCLKLMPSEKSCRKLTKPEDS